MSLPTCITCTTPYQLHIALLTQLGARTQPRLQACAVHRQLLQLGILVSKCHLQRAAAA